MLYGALSTQPVTASKGLVTVHMKLAGFRTCNTVKNHCSTARFRLFGGGEGEAANRDEQAEGAVVVLAEEG